MSTKCCKRNLNINNFIGDAKEDNYKLYLAHKNIKEESREKGYIKLSELKDNHLFEINETKTAILIERNYGLFNTKTWQVFLINEPINEPIDKPNKEYFYSNFIENKKEITEHFCHNDDIHRGHYIGKQFSKFLIPKEIFNDSRIERKINWFFGKGNKDNIYYQTKEANCNSNKILGQLYFENEIVNFLNNNESKRVVYYEIEDVLFEKVSIGRKLIIVKYEGDTEISYQHLFIPNNKK